MVRNPTASARGSTLSRTLNGVLILASLAAIAVALAVGLTGSRGIQLPIADQAGPPEGTTKNVIEIPASWNDDFPAARAELGKRYKEFENRIKAAQASEGADEDKDRTLTLRMDYRVRFRILQEVLLAGQLTGLWRHQLACRKSASVPGQTGYLIIRFPDSSYLKGAPDFEHMTDLWFAVDRVGGKLVYVIRPEYRPYKADNPENRRLNGLHEFEQALRLQRAKTPRLLPILDAATEITVQDFVDVFNAAIKAGCRNIAVAKPRD